MQNLILQYSYVDIILAFSILGLTMKFLKVLVELLFFYKKSNLELESMKLDNKKKRLEIKQFKKN